MAAFRAPEHVCVKNIGDGAIGRVGGGWGRLTPLCDVAPGRGEGRRVGSEPCPSAQTKYLGFFPAWRDPGSPLVWLLWLLGLWWVGATLPRGQGRRGG